MARVMTAKEKVMELSKAKKDALKAAWELGYYYLFDNIETTIKNAKSVDDVSNIMCNYRKAM